MKKVFFVLAIALCAINLLGVGFALGRLYTINTSTLLECSNHHAAINFNGNEVYYAN